MTASLTMLQSVATAQDEVSQLDDKTEKTAFEPNREEDYPDGGVRAWLVVAGTWSSTFSTFGLVNAWGVFQAYYETHILKDSSSSNIAWIGSLQYALVFFPAILVGRLFDLGWFRLPYALGSACLIIATFLTAECKRYWQFLLCQGIFMGISCGVCYGPIIAIIGHWFKRRRGLALSTMALGSSVGGTIFPIAARGLIPKVGFQWTMRIIAFILIITLGFSFIAMTRRLPGKNVPGGLLNWRSLKSPAFTIYCLSSFVAYLGMYTLLTFVDISAVSAGVPSNFSFYLVSISNAASGFGRLATGLVVDKIGAVNFIVPMTVAAAMVTYVWPLAHTKSQFIAIVTLYGFASSAYVSTFQMPIYELGEIEDVGRRAGLAMMFSAVGAVAGPPISGAINGASKGFSTVGYYAGSMMLLACIMMLTTRYLVLRRIRGKF